MSSMLIWQFHYLVAHSHVLSLLLLLLLLQIVMHVVAAVACIPFAICGFIAAAAPAAAACAYDVDEETNGRCEEAHRNKQRLIGKREG